MRIISSRLARYPRVTIAAVGGCFLLLVLTLFVLDMRDRYITAVERAQQSALNYAEVLAEHTARAFEAVDLSLHEARLIRANVAKGSGDDTGAHAAGIHDANEQLRHLQQSSPLLVSIGWTDAAGNLEAHSNEGAPPITNIAGHPHFRTQRDAADHLYVGPPFQSGVDGRWLSAVSRRISNADGSFAGIVGAVLDQTYFAGIYRSIDLGRNGAVLLMTRDGAPLVREPPLEGIFTRNYSHGPLLSQHLPKAEAGSYQGVSTFDGATRLFGYRAVNGLPLVITVSYDRADVLAPFYRDLFRLAPLMAAVVLMFMFGAGLLIWQTRTLARKTDILEVTLENMAHGLCLFDNNKALTLCNRRYIEMYGLEPQQIAGSTLRSILEARKIPQEEIERRLHQVSLQQPYHAVYEEDHGRIISVNYQPVQEGGWVAIHQDITDRRRDEEKVAFMAHHDVLTGLPNRTYFIERLEEAAERLRRREEPFTVLLLDLDRFKNVNDSLGHPAGDVLLKETAQRLKSAVRSIDVLARLGGDEFAIIQCGEHGQEEAAVTVANRIIDILTEPYKINGHDVTVGTSVGIALAPADGSDADGLMKKADLALYRAKSEGRNGYRFFDQRMSADAEARRQMEAELRAAFADEALELHYQPIVDVNTRKLFGLEALLRWKHPVRGYISPADFVPLAEETGLIHALGEWVLMKACSDAAKWPGHVKVSVNLSPVQFRKANLLDVILCVLIDTGIAPERLELEITESTLLENESQYLSVMHQLKNLGISISLDDFGTGYSSLSYITLFPFDKIKIDRSFTKNLTRRADCAAIISSVLALAEGLELPTVAEGVESEQQFEILRASGVRYAQGFLFGQPCRAEEIDFDRAWVKPWLENVA